MAGEIKATSTDVIGCMVANSIQKQEAHTARDADAGARSLSL